MRRRGRGEVERKRERWVTITIHFPSNTHIIQQHRTVVPHRTWLRLLGESERERGVSARGERSR